MTQEEIEQIIRQQAQDLYEHHAALGDSDAVAFYPPEKVSERHRLAIAYTALNGSTYHVGDWAYAFPLHSISKVFNYGIALEDNGRDETLRRVGVEPSGDAFNSFVFDERHKRPFNPMVNSGALVTVNLIKGANTKEKVDRVLERLRTFAANPNLTVDEKVLEDEFARYSDRNLGLCYLMRSQGMLTGDIQETMMTYLSLCCVRVTAQDLATMGATLANGGVNPLTGVRALEQGYVRHVLTVMYTCGMYDYAGEWAYDVGLPAKSSVAGAIFFAMPNSFGAGIYSPGLDIYGNSVRGVRVCRDPSSRFGLHLFSDPSEERLGLSAAEWRRIGRE